MRDFRKHISRFHPESDGNVEAQDSAESSTYTKIDSPLPDGTTNDYHEFDVESPSFPPTPIQMNHYSKKQSKSFFRMVHEGYSYADAIMKTSFPDVNPDSFTENEKLLHLSIADLCSKIPVSARNRLSKIIKLVEDVVTERINSKLTSDNVSGWYPLPKTPSEMRTRFMEGRHAVLPNLAHPKATMLDDDHSYVSPIDIFAHHFGYGIPSDLVVRDKPPPSVSSITESLRACRMVFNSKMVHFHRSACDRVDIVPSLCWSDKAEIHTQKTNRKSSAWAKTMTIQPPKDRQNTPANTYVVSLGSHDGCRQNVEKRFIQDFTKLCNGSLAPFYDGSTKRMAHIHSELLCDIRDIPERVEGLFLGAGNGAYTRVFRHAINFGAKSASPQHADLFLYEVFPSCPECIKRREQMETIDIDSVGVCCANWDLQCPGSILHIVPPAKYPQSEVPSCGSLPPLSLSTEQLISSCKLAFDSLVSKEWTQATVSAYLQQRGLNAAAVECTNENATRVLRMADLSNCDGISPNLTRELRYLKNLRNAEPNLFCPFTSATWQLLGLRDYAETVMHHLCQGSSSTLAKDVDLSIKADGKHALMLREMSGRLESVANLRLDWLKALDEGQNGKRGGYVGENYLALMQLMPWYYSIIPKLFQMSSFSEGEIEEYIEPEKPIEEWRVDELKQWLKGHGFTQKGKENTTLKADLRARIIELQQSDLPPMLSDAVSGASVDDISRVIISLKAMVCRIMVAEVSSADIDEIDRHIKLFLSYYDIFWLSIKHKESSKGRKNQPRWMLSTKQASLLLLPETMRRYGPLRGLWEGGPRGEGGLRPVKSELTRFHGQWQLNSHNRIMQKKAFSFMMNQVDEMEDDDDVVEFGERSTKFYSFRKLESLAVARKTFLKGNLPFSVLQNRAGSFGIPVCPNRLLLIERGDVYGESMGCSYIWWSLSNTVIELDEKSLVNNCCFLPVIYENVSYEKDSIQRVYTGITSKWTDLQGNGTYSQIKIPEVKYNS